MYNYPQDCAPICPEIGAGLLVLPNAGRFYFDVDAGARHDVMY